jgi:acetyltransferase-like isoleucine patch superfamily enzyme
VPTGGSVIEDGVWIGARCTVIGRVTVGEGTVVGAHSLVKESLPGMTVAYGSPAKAQRER